MPVLTGQFSDGRVAVNKALQLVENYMSRVSTQKAIDKLAAKYAPSIGRGESEAKAIAVFDIDDTLIFDVDPQPLPHPIVIELFDKLHALGVEVHLVTARVDEEDMRRITVSELAEAGVRNYKSLSFAPQSARSSMKDVSTWKMETRRSIATHHKSPITLTVGDQWGDMVVLKHDSSIDKLDKQFGTRLLPYLIVRPEDAVSLWGLKLPAY
jgi:hypothetical protein